MALHPKTFDAIQPTLEQRADMALLQTKFSDIANEITVIVPDSIDKMYLLRKLRECAMWANAAITQHSDGSPRT